MHRILVVESEESVRSLMVKILKRAGYEVLAVASTREAIALCSAFSIDVLISDASMPGIDGHGLVQSVVRQHPSIRCILMSAIDISDCNDCPFLLQCNLLPKPFKPADVIRLVKAQLQ